MPVDRVDVNLPGALPQDVAAAVAQNRAETQDKINEGDKEAAARKAAEKKIAEKRAELKDSVVQRETFQRQNDLQARMQQILGGAHGAEAAAALADWNGNQQLQAKLTYAQKSLWCETMAQSPARGAEAAKALQRLTQQPGFQQAITNAQQMGTLQAGIVQNPRAAEGPAAQMLRGRFMQSPNADAQAKNQFLRFGLHQAAKGQLDAMRRAGDMLGTLATAGISRGAQRAAMGMVERNPGDPHAAASVDAFVRHPEVRALPSFARDKAALLLSKADGKPEVKEGFEQLASEPRFKAQAAQNKGRFFATIGSGRPSELRALTDQSLTALRSGDFPKRDGQVGRFLNKMAAQVQRGGAASVDTGALIKEAKKSPLPAPPRLTSAAGLDEEEAARVRAQNRGQVLHYFNQIQRLYDQGEKRLKVARFLEDVNALQTLREPPPVDTSALSPEERAIYDERERSLGERRAQVLKLQAQRSRELRNKRMPPARRRALLAERRAVGRQPRYFQPSSGRVSATRAYAEAATGTHDGAAARGMKGGAMRAGVPPFAGAGTPVARAGGGVSGEVQAHVAAAVAQLGSGPITTERAAHVARVVAQQVAQQVAEQVAAQLLGGGGPGPTVEDHGQKTAPTVEQRSTVKTDGWGVQRVFDRDLGTAGAPVVKPARAVEDPSREATASEKYTGKTLVKDGAAVRSLDALLAVSWKSLTKGEMALLKNLGWGQQAWDTKDTPTARWPMAMATAFVALTPVQREAVRKLGLSPHAWDERVQALAMGKRT